MKPTFIRPATMEDVSYVANNLREADRQEVLASVGLEPSIALPPFVAEGREVYACGLCSNDRAEVLWGLDPIFGEDRAAVIWLLSTPVMYDHPVEFAIKSREGFEMAHSKYDLLTNFIDARNTRHIKWLKWLGFATIRRVERFGFAGIPFIEFASYRPCA